MFKEQTLFDKEKLVMRSDAMTQQLDELEALIIPMERIIAGLDKQLITNKVVTNSTVNRNKKKKGKLA